ncbi:MAG: CarD family transcriptional regulator, partial [Candidatus Porifericomitaceae bacterium WSBS_2022_MAG_OTU9]
MTAKLVPPEPPRPGAGSDSLWAGLRDAASAYAIATAALHWQRPLLLLAPDPQIADRWLYELQFFLAGRLPLLLFPDRETLPYDKLAPSADLLSERLQLFVELPKLQRGVVVAPLSAALHRTPPARHCADALHLEPGAKVDLTQLRDQLAACGYRFVQQVAERGEAAVRGSLIDVFPMGLAKQPCRIDLYDDRIEQMRWFDSETQLSAEQATSLDILPAAEVPLSTASLESFRIALRDFCEGDPMRSDVYRGVRQGHLPAGIEYYLPLFFADTSDLFAYLPQDTVLIHDSSLWTQAEDFYQDAEQRYQRLKKESEHEPILPPAQLFLDQEQLQSRSKGFARVLLQEQIDQSADFNLDAHRVPPVTVDARAPDPFAMLRRFIDRHKGYSVLLSCDSKGAMEAMLESLTPAQMKIHICTDFDDFVAGRHSLAAVPQSLDRGMLLAGEKIVVFAEPHIFGRKFRRRKQGKSRSAAQALRNLTELVIGSPVVHEDYGIGRYQGLEVITHNELDAEFILLHYADGDKLYVPVMLAHRIQRYSGTDPEHAPLHNLGGGQWQKSKARAAKQAHDTAAELLLLQAKRQSRTRPPFTMQPEQNVFRNSFRYTETTDQEQAIDAVLSDLQAATPMDRLIAG